MARVGIDYGTTNTVVISNDRGRYPVVPHTVETQIGSVIREVFPSQIVWDKDSGRFYYGLEAERLLLRSGAGHRYEVIRSIKRLLKDYVDGGRIGQEFQAGGFDLAELLKGFAEALRQSVQSSGVLVGDEPLDAVLTWPANANGAQRHITRQCFREAGFEIVGTLNEPSAAAIEFADRMARGNRAEARKMSMTVGIFDLGGGTFDASLVKIHGSQFSVVDAAGIEELGGDDFDEVLARLFAHKMGFSFDELSPQQRTLLLMNACRQKEGISSGSVRQLTVSPSELGLGKKTGRVKVSEFFERLRGRLTPAVETLFSVVSGPAARAAGVNPEELDAVYLVGGSSRLPLVPKMVAERFPGVQIVITDKPFTSTAMGAAIRSTEEVVLRDIFSRHFGVIRLSDHGTREYFAPIFQAGALLPERNGTPLKVRVGYQPQHNIGHLRYLECSVTDPQGQPSSGVRVWSDVLFPYDPAIPVGEQVNPEQVAPVGELGGQTIDENYLCDSDGIITVTLTRSSDGRSRSYEIFQSRRVPDSTVA